MKKNFEDNVKDIAELLVSRHLSSKWSVRMLEKRDKDVECSSSALSLMAYCRYKNNTINLMLPNVRKHKSFPLWVDTTLHEIAHARIPFWASGHGYMWKRECKKLGASPEKYSNPKKYIK